MCSYGVGVGCCRNCWTTRALTVESSDPDLGDEELSSLSLCVQVALHSKLFFTCIKPGLRSV